MHRYKAWFSGWDDTRDDDLTHEERVLLQTIPRETRGSGRSRGLVRCYWADSWFKQGQIDNTPCEATGQCASTHPTHPWAAPRGRRCMRWVTKLIPSPILTVVHEGHASTDGHCDVRHPGVRAEESQQRLVQQPGCFRWLGACRLSRVGGTQPTGPRGTCTHR